MVQSLPCREFYFRLEVSTQGLLSLNGFEQSFEVPFAKGFRTIAFDDLKK